MIRGNTGVAAFAFSKEGVAQGDPLAMVVYGLGILPLILQLKEEFPSVSQQWYAGDAGAGAKFADIRRQFTRLQKNWTSLRIFS
jgi:hypothetical protein